MRTIREYIAQFLYWLGHRIINLGYWIDPPYDPNTLNLTEETKQQLRDMLMNNE